MHHRIMPSHTSLLNAPFLPYDILRLIFEEATRDDIRKAVVYTVISKLVRGWVEICLYENVQLYREKTLQKFVRTLEASSKPPGFFTTRVKSLAVTYNILDVRRLCKIISTCRGVQSLSIWNVPTNTTPPAKTLLVNRVGASRAYHSPTPRLFHLLPKSTFHQEPEALAIYLDALADLRPKYVSLQLHYPLKFLINSGLLMKRHNSLCHEKKTLSAYNLFSDVTHLSIVDSWQEWCSWTWEPILWNFDYHDVDFSSPFLSPNLTHLSFDIQVGKGHDGFSRSNFVQRIGRTLTHILLNPHSRYLHTLVCILSFDDDPFTTVRMIRSEIESTTPSRGTPRNKEVTAMTHLRGPSTDSEVSSLMQDLRLFSSVYPKLVFTYDPEPFKDREAHSDKVKIMWKHADELVRLRRKGQMVKTCGLCRGEGEELYW